MKNFFFAFVLILVGISESHAQFWAKSNGRFGIGDENAYAKLQVNALSSFANPGIALLDSSATNTAGGILQFRSITWDDNHFNLQAKIGEFATGQDSKLDFFFRENLIMSIEGGSTPDRQLIYNPRDGIFRTGHLNPGARGEYSVAMGYGNLASGLNSVALGGGNQAVAEGTTALGGGSTAEGTYATVIGYDNYAQGPFSLAAGKQSSALEINAVAIGDSAVASGVTSHAIGYKTLASAHSSTATGHLTDATGLYSFAGGYATQATNTSSTAFGFVSQATGVSASAFGYSTIAGGENSVAFNSVTKALGHNSLTAGFETKTTGWGSSAFGDHTIARSYASAVFGAFNDTIATSNPEAWVSTDPLLMVGNGVSHADRNNAFTIYKNGSILAKNPTTVSFPGGVDPPVSGEGTRLMWIPEMSAFRVGTVENNEWDSSNIGPGSFASGINCKASGYYAVALGSGTQSTSNNSMAVGENSSATGINSIALGNTALASGDDACSIGSTTTASGHASFAIGNGTTASGGSSSAMGDFTQASGSYSTSMGKNTKAKAFASTAIGYYNNEIPGSSMDSWVETDPLFMIGNGANEFLPHNALTVYKNGNLLMKYHSLVEVDPGVIIPPANGAGTRMMWLQDKSAFRVGTVTNNSWNAENLGTWSFASGFNPKASGAVSTSIGSNTTASGITSTALGYESVASGDYATALGHNTLASGNRSTAMGTGTEASGGYSTAMGSVTRAIGIISTAMGYNNEASGDYSTAIGYSTFASGSHSTAMGYSTEASGDASTAMGWNTWAEGWMTSALGRGVNAKAFASTAIGSYNDEIATSSETTWVETDPIFIVGNGEFGFAPSNAMVVYKNANTDINGYTRLGEASESAPRIKMKELPLTVAGVNYNSFVSIPHGLMVSKILSVSVFIEWDDNLLTPPEYSPSLNLRYNYYVNATDIVVQNNTPSGDCLICERPVHITITYKE